MENFANHRIFDGAELLTNSYFSSSVDMFAVKLPKSCMFDKNITFLRNCSRCMVTFSRKSMIRLSSAGDSNERNI